MLCTRLVLQSKKESYLEVALHWLRAANAVDKAATNLEGDEAIGATIVRRAIEAPLRKLCDNAGVEGSLVFNRYSNLKVLWVTM